MTDHNFSSSRRKFIQTAATAAIGAPFLRRCSSGGTSPKNILRHACIGVGGMGWSDLQKFKEDPNVQIAAICDVDANNLKKASEALLIPHNGMPVLLPESKFTDYKTPRFESGNHYHSFVVACLGGPKTESHFAQTGPMTEAILLGTVAIRMPDILLEWDAAGMKFTNNPDADKYLRRNYRKGWKVAGF